MGKRVGTVVNTNIYGWGQKHIRRNKLVGTESHTNGKNRGGQKQDTHTNGKTKTHTDTQKYI